MSLIFVRNPVLVFRTLTELPLGIGPVEHVPYERLETAVDDESTACSLQGMVFPDVMRQYRLLTSQPMNNMCRYLNYWDGLNIYLLFHC